MAEKVNFKSVTESLASVTTLPPIQIRVAAAVRGKISVVPKGISKATSEATALRGDATNPIEFDLPYNTARTAVAAGNYIFIFDVEEASANSLEKTGYTFRVDVHANGTLRGTFCIGQVKSADNQVVEGVSCIVDVGETIPSSIFILVLPIKLPQ